MSNQYDNSHVKIKSKSDLESFQFMRGEAKELFWLRLLKTFHDSSLLSNHGMKLLKSLKDEQKRVGSVATKDLKLSDFGSSSPDQDSSD